MTPPPQVGDNAAGVALAAEIFAGATSARWPMYLRNVKQILRAAGGFDERRYGFGGLLELLRACQREGFVRMERDRRGGLRVFQGPSLGRGAQPVPEAVERPPVHTTLDAQVSEILEPPAALVVEGIEDVLEVNTATVIDTTAELLGRAKPRPGRNRVAGGGGQAPAEGTAGKATRKTAKKSGAVARRSSRSKKPTGEPAAGPRN
jgi:hypothetical protein